MPVTSKHQDNRPKVFVGSSVEGLKYAETIQLNLQYNADCQLWNQGIFAPTVNTLEQLVNSVGNFDFAIFVITPDDLTTRRGVVQSTGRDNVIFELGLFMGRLGRERTLIVHPRDRDLNLPSDLLGITAITFQHSNNTPLPAAMGATCTQIAQHIRTSRVRRTSTQDNSGDQQVAALEERLNSIQQSLRDLVRGPVQSGISLRRLVGAWRGFPTGSHAYAEIVDGELIWPYCYGGNEELTGFYHSFESRGDTLTGRFNWLDREVSGHAYFEVLSRDQLEGGWWYSADANFDEIRDMATTRSTPKSIREAMYPIAWKRQQGTKRPRWVETALKQWPKFKQTLIDP